MFVPGNTQYGIWLRSPSASGGKDWLGFLTDRDVVSQWGKTGQVNQSKVIAESPSRTFLDRKIEEKRRKGYQLVGEWFPGSGWSHQNRSQPPPVPPTSPRPTLPPPPPLDGKVLHDWLTDTDSSQWF